MGIWKIIMNLLAQNLDTIQTKGVPGFKGGTNIATLIKNTNIFSWIIFGSAFLLLIYMLLGGLQLMTSRGDPKGVAGAWGKITNAVIGFIIVFMAYFITILLGEVLGVKGFKGVF